MKLSSYMTEPCRFPILTRDGERGSKLGLTRVPGLRDPTGNWPYFGYRIRPDSLDNSLLLFSCRSFTALFRRRGRMPENATLLYTQTCYIATEMSIMTPTVMSHCL